MKTCSRHRHVKPQIDPESRHCQFFFYCRDDRLLGIDLLIIWDLCGGFLFILYGRDDRLLGIDLILSGTCAEVCLFFFSKIRFTHIDFLTLIRLRRQPQSKLMRWSHNDKPVSSGSRLRPGS